MAVVVLDIAKFRERFTAFSDETLFPDALITTTFDTATIYVSDETSDCFPEKKLELAIYQMMAHLLTVQDAVNNGGQTGTVLSSSIGAVSITIAAPKNSDEFEFWLNQTPYGQQFLALLNTVCVGGFYFGGDAPRTAYRENY